MKPAVRHDVCVCVCAATLVLTQQWVIFASISTLAMVQCVSCCVLRRCDTTQQEGCSWPGVQSRTCYLAAAFAALTLCLLVLWVSCRGLASAGVCVAHKCSFRRHHVGAASGPFGWLVLHCFTVMSPDGVGPGPHRHTCTNPCWHRAGGCFHT